MTRRDASWAILRAASAAGGQAFFSRWLQAAQAAAAAMHTHSEGSPPPPDPHDWAAYKPQFFSAADFHTLDLFTSTLIPTDDTPGAREACVSQFIDFVVNAAAEYAPAVQEEWRRAMDYLRGQDFASMTEEQRVSFLERISAPERHPSQHDPGFTHYRLIKQMTVHAFYTSRVGLVDVLEYKGFAYLTAFPGCDHPEHHQV
ncbi:MAG: gluconate 2-dehydrogenase subunit 3 family protein [Acidobacteriaceae bacterium]|nr:gluconate 2-dehydrogenase subunit 3 family protein [Acidobacteriaceae bacterium]